MASTSDTDEIKAITSQKLELIHAKTLESDLDFAFRLQLEEAMAASLSLFPSSSSSPPTTNKPLQSPPINDTAVFNIAEFMSEELEKLEQEKKDRELSEFEARKSREDLSRRLHDQKLALDIVRLPEEDWDEFGDEFERPFGEGSSSSTTSENITARLYFKGLVSVERIGDSDVAITGIGVAVCDLRDNLIFQLSKPFVGTRKNRQIAEIKALIEGLEIAVALDLKRITIFCDYPPIYQYVRRVWQPKQRKVYTLMRKVEVLRKQFTYSRPCLVPRSVIKFAFKLARDAIASQSSKSAESNNVNNLKETCVICLEEKDQANFFAVDGCQHKYCFSCMKQHVEAKLHSGIVPKCPHESCKHELNVKSCEKFLAPKLIEIMKQRIKEASIPVTEKVYCPYPRCSVLMSKAGVSDFTKNKNIMARMYGARNCVKCHGLFCVHCKVPWHQTMTCEEYKRSSSYVQPDDAKLKSLATMNLWRQCVKCNHMIELAEGCYHMTCRCGYEFCYTCGAEWKNKKATCSCPLWDVENILDDSEFDVDDYDDEEEDDDDDDDYSDSDSDWY